MTTHPCSMCGVMEFSINLPLFLLSFKPVFTSVRKRLQGWWNWFYQWLIIVSSTFWSRRRAWSSTCQPEQLVFADTYKCNTSSCPNTKLSWHEITSVREFTNTSSWSSLALSPRESGITLGRVGAMTTHSCACWPHNVSKYNPILSSISYCCLLVTCLIVAPSYNLFVLASILRIIIRRWELILNCMII